jgi:hypothetical protein
MSRDFFDPTPEEQNVILIDAATLQKAQRMNRLRSLQRRCGDFRSRVSSIG